MPSIHVTHRPLVFALLAVLPGCLGASSPSCEETVTVLADVTSPTPADRSAADLLAVIEGEHTSELVWTQQDDDAVVVEIERSGTTPLTLTIAYEGGEVRWVDNQTLDPPGPNDAIDVECLPRLEIDAKLGLTTGDGAFAELFDVVVRAEANYSNELHWAEVLHEFDPEGLVGALEVLSVSPADPDEIEYHVDLRVPLDEYTDLMPGVPRGYVDGFAVYEGHGPAPSGAVAIGRFELASFGPLDSQ